MRPMDHETITIKSILQFLGEERSMPHNEGGTQKSTVIGQVFIVVFTGRNQCISVGRLR